MKLSNYGYQDNRGKQENLSYDSRLQDRNKSLLTHYIYHTYYRWAQNEYI